MTAATQRLNLVSIEIVKPRLALVVNLKRTSSTYYLMMHIGKAHMSNFRGVVILLSEPLAGSTSQDASK